MSRVFALIIIVFFWLGICLVPAKGANKSLAVLPAVKVDTPPAIDGDLSDPIWQVATKVTGFYNTDEARPAAAETIVYIGYDAKNIYVAFHCLDSQPDKIKAEQCKRGGGLWADDWVAIDIDTYHQHRSAYYFNVNPRGTQGERMPGGTSTKIEWIGDWYTAAKIVTDGWVAEMAIPFDILKYPKGADTFGLMFVRRLAREHEMSFLPLKSWEQDMYYWADWVGLELPALKNRPIILGYSMARAQPGGSFHLLSGLDIKYMWTPELTALLTANPDFGNVEQEVETIDFSYTERRLPDRRPFFEEGRGFMPRSRMFYSRRMENIDLGAKVVGKKGNYSIGLLDAVDFGDRNDFVLNLGRDVGERSGFNIAAVDVKKPGLHNTVLFAGPRLGLKRGKREAHIGGGIYQSFNGNEKRGKSWHFDVDTSAGPGHLGGAFQYGSVDADYEAEDGFVPEKDQKGFDTGVSYGERFYNQNLEGYQIWTGTGCWRHQDGSFFKKGFSCGNSIWFRDGSGCWLNFGKEQREQYHDKTWNFGINWNGDDLYRNGYLSISKGIRANEDYFFLRLEQGFKASDVLTFRLNAEYVKMTPPGEPLQRVSQLVFTANYDITSERSLGLRWIRKAGKNNIFLTYRQVVRRGMDAFLIYGDPNAEKTINRFAGKLIFPF